MNGFPIHGMSNKQLTKILFQSLENEELLDLHVAKRYFDETELIDLPNFKHLKLMPFKQRYGSPFIVLLNILAYLIPIKSFFEMLAWMIFRCLVPGRASEGFNCAYIAFFERHAPLLQRVLRADEHMNPAGLHRSDIVRRLLISDMVDAVMIVKSVFQIIRGCPPLQRRNLRLQAWNICGLTLVALHGRRFRDMPIATSDILQRWAYVIGHTTQKVWMIQHGFVAIGVKFKHAFSRVDRIYAYSDKQFENYSTYYGASNLRLISSDIELKNIGGSRNALFLASSAPHVDEEIALIQALKSKLEIPLAIKLHPRHFYDERGEKLLKLADIVIPANADPECKVFLSHSSFYGLMYQRQGIKSIAFSEYETIGVLSSALKECGIINDVK